MAIIRDKRAVLQEKRALLEAAGDSGSVAECDAQLAQEVAKREMWSAENVRRHHNYVPLVVDLFKVLAEKGKLGGMVTGAREKAAASAKAKPIVLFVRCVVARRRWRLGAQRPDWLASCGRDGGRPVALASPAWIVIVREWY